MSKPFVTVDYFSHNWDPSDLGCASQELKRQIAQVQRKLISVDNELETQHDSLRQWGLGSPRSASRALSSLSKEKHRLLSDEYRLARLDNISWRQYKASTPDAPKIDPIAINWQKNSDVIWLYGPLFCRDENDKDFEKRLGGLSDNHTQQSSSLKPALRKRKQTKEEYVQKMLGSSVFNSKKYKRRSYPVSQPVDLDAIHDSNNKKELRFKPDVLEYIYHADVPLHNNQRQSPPRGKPDPRKPSNNSRGASSAAQRAKALLLAARSSSPSPPPESPIMPPSPPLSPSDEGYIKIHPDDTGSSPIVNLPEPQQGGWFWSFYSPSTPQEQVESIPSLCANLFSLSAEVITLMGTVAVYKGVSYGLGCPASQQQSRPVNRSNCS
ncbi:hypothetical protein BJV82DRAFT_589812 [Fennellomyces sp. T-0311]|nr:hypothetical protein BJV82DRAFT_589812 [Fennellomyces sp. T-0311]